MFRNCNEEGIKLNKDSNEIIKNSKIILLFFVFISVVFIYGCSADRQNSGLKSEEKINVGVSIVPQGTFVRAVGGDKVDVITMIPPGKSPENFAPTPEMMKKFSDLDIYFTIGVPTEEASILPNIRDFNEDVKIVDMADEVSKVYNERKFESGERESSYMAFS